MEKIMVKGGAAKSKAKVPKEKENNGDGDGNQTPKGLTAFGGLIPSLRRYGCLWRVCTNDDESLGEADVLVVTKIAGLL